MKFNRDNKIILILYFYALIFWLLTIGITNIDYLKPDDFLGVAGKLPIFFWISLIFLILGIIKNYYTKNIWLFYFGIILLNLILFVTYPFIEPNGRHGVSYMVTGISKQIVEGEYFSKLYDIHPLNFPYLAYQGFPIFITTFREITGLSFVNLVKFLPSLLIFTVSFSIFALFIKMSNQIHIAFIGVVIFNTLNSWHLFLVPELLTISLLPIFLLIMYINLKNPHIFFKVLLIIVLFTIILTHIIAPVVIILFLSTYYTINLYVNKINKPTLLLFSIILFVGYFIYVAHDFFNSAILSVLNAFQSTDSFLNALTVDEAKRSMPFERRVSSILLLLPLLVSVMISMITIINLFLIKNYKNYMFPESYFLGSLFLLLIPYGADANISRMASFLIIGSSFFVGLYSKKHLKSVLFLSIIFILLHPLAYSGGGTKVSFIPTSELSGTKFFVETTNKTSNYFTQSSESIVNYQDPFRAFRQDVYTLWKPPVRDFDIDWKFVYLLYGIRDNTGLVYYLDYDPIYKHMDEINKKFNKFYENNHFIIFARAGD